MWRLQPFATQTRLRLCTGLLESREEKGGYFWGTSPFLQGFTRAGECGRRGHFHTLELAYAHGCRCHEGRKVYGPGSLAATTLEECWDLVNTHEATGTHMMLLENVNYRRDILAVLRMVREGVFGELIHFRCGYQHDLREVKLNNGQQPYGGG